MHDTEGYIGELPIIIREPSIEEKIEKVNQDMEKK
jgi:hypothetical protein